MFLDTLRFERASFHTTAFRARLVQACADGTLNSAVARRYHTTNTTVGKWRQRFVEWRLEGIYDEPRAGAPHTITDEDVETVIVSTLETTPPGETHWSTNVHRQDRLRTLERLNLGLLIEREHGGICGRIHVEPNDDFLILDKVPSVDTQNRPLIDS